MENRQREIVGILLAAGAGARFGGEKLLHPLPDGVAIGAHAARNLIAAGLTVVAVVKPGDFPLYDLFEQEGCRVTFCPHAARNAGGWVIALGDMPRIRPDTIKRVVQALQEGAAIAAPAYRGERGHPVGFGAQFLGELTQLSADSGARAILERHRQDIRLVDCDDPGVLYDVDRKVDLTASLQAGS
jgi:molybdenum cofactor cytidylyltransferase